MLVQQRPPVSVSVLVYTDDGMAIVQPVQRDFLEDHIHYKVRLYAQPAGTNWSSSPASRRRHPPPVDTPDPTLPGWLPADHAIFNGRAPTGAVFGYNLATHPQLARIFPPIPPIGAPSSSIVARTRWAAKLVPMGLRRPVRRRQLRHLVDEQLPGRCALARRLDRSRSRP